MDNDAASTPVAGSVAELTAVHGWTVTTGVKGRWITADRAIDAGGHHWVIGLTPTAGGAIALMLWSDDVLICHRRGSEAETCRTAHRWAADLLSGRLAVPGETRS